MTVLGGTPGRQTGARVTMLDVDCRRRNGMCTLGCPAEKLAADTAVPFRTGERHEMTAARCSLVVVELRRATARISTGRGQRKAGSWERGAAPPLFALPEPGTAWSADRPYAVVMHTRELVATASTVALRLTLFRAAQ